MRSPPPGHRRDAARGARAAACAARRRGALLDRCARRGAQVVMFGLLGLKSSGVRSAALQTVALLPLPLLTLAQWLSVGDLFAAPLRVLSLKAAAELDRRDQARPRSAPSAVIE